MRCNRGSTARSAGVARGARAPHVRCLPVASVAPAAARSGASKRATWSAEPILVSGAGIAGLAVAVALSKIGLPVHVFEAGPGLRQEGAAIGLWANAWRALEALGAADGLRAGHLPLSRWVGYWACVALTPPADAAGRQRAALDVVRGWSWSMEEVIRRTPPEDIAWSRVSDRWTAGSFGRGCVTLAGDAAHPMTPNLGQGGCVALEDAVVLGQRLAALAAQRAPPSPSALAACLRAFEADRSARCLPLTVRSNLMGAALQTPLQPVCAVRNAFVRTVFQPSHFLDHTTFDCGTL
ncbi:Zeaxanthin epoxidase, chloroplastic [Tetrabaena socialis]|uniref:Zeaxanthin epoxidase, chloroplastic n=1 Tax=Tetrabaena socialis TaxID=47790 RepID=A0A2J7ZNN2_9CHLO|nr:Zeaxanthin epoxidase, chloroplastic [Tetrabaena socialis]|eukprot:PNH01883.1 Zeaxanthin epoxidase, chloroplastic [Tetrabaena socialis]